MNRDFTGAAIAAALAILLTSTNLSVAAQIRQPQGPITTPDPGDNKPAVDFDQDIWTKLAKQDPYANLSCSMWTNPTTGYPQIWMFNHSGKTIPAGSVLTWTLPGGKTVTLTTTLPIYPGSGMAISAPPSMTKMVGFWCKVEVNWTPARVL
jgi:hypothetical protein